MARLLVSSLLLFFALSAPAATNVVSSGTTELLLPSVVTLDARYDMPTGRVDTAGAFVREGPVIRQYTANGWVVCPTFRYLVVVQRLSGAGTAVVTDGRGDLVRLTDSFPAVVLTDAHAPATPISVRAEGGDVTVFTSSR